MDVCPAGHLSKDPENCEVCGLPMAGDPQTDPVPAEDVAGEFADTSAEVHRGTAGRDGGGPHAATVAIPAEEVLAGAQTTAIPADDVNAAASTDEIPVEAVRKHPATTVLPDAPPGNPTVAMPTDSGPGTQVMPVVEPAPVPEQPATQVISPPPPPASPQPPAVFPAAASPSDAPPAVDPPGQDRSSWRPPTGATSVMGPRGAEVTGWNVVLTVDEAWYAVQDTPHRLPSPGRSTVVPLTVSSALIGRRSRSRGTVPEIDCSSDPGVSRRHALLERTGGRWFIEDLGSANGTYVAAAGAPLPEHPITPGRRVEVGAGDTVYLGAWTRLSLDDDDAWIPTT